MLLCITAVLRVREVIPGSGRVLGIQVDNNYISMLTSKLTENVTILFDLPSRMNNDIVICVFVDLR